MLVAWFHKHPVKGICIYSRTWAGAGRALCALEGDLYKRFFAIDSIVLCSSLHIAIFYCVSHLYSLSHTVLQNQNHVIYYVSSSSKIEWYLFNSFTQSVRVRDSELINHFGSINMLLYLIQWFYWVVLILTLKYRTGAE